MGKTPVCFLIVTLIYTACAQAAIQTEAIEYRHGDLLLEGYLAYDDAGEGKRPGVMVVHEWKGLNDYAKRRARQLAELGYIAFAVDMYGKGVVAKDHEEAARFSGAYREDRQLMRERARAGLGALRRHPLTDPDRLAAIGYCFGGTAVLELARSGEPLKGVVSFHGGLDTPYPGDTANVTARVLVLHGADDPYVTQGKVTAFEEEMRGAGVDFQVIQYPGAVHSFTVQEAGNDPSQGAAYNASADAASWDAMQTFLREIFQKE